MPLLLFQIPKCSNQLNSARIRFEQYYKLERFPLEKYLSIEEASQLYPKKNFFESLTTRNTFFGFQVSGTTPLFIHPGTFYRYIQRYYRQRLTRGLTMQDLQGIN